MNATISSEDSNNSSYLTVENSPVDNPETLAANGEVGNMINITATSEDSDNSAVFIILEDCGDFPPGVELKEVEYSVGQYGIYATQEFDVGFKFGPYPLSMTENENKEMNSDEPENESVGGSLLDDPKAWANYVNFTTKKKSANIDFVESQSVVYIHVVKSIKPGDELLLWSNEHTPVNGVEDREEKVTRLSKRKRTSPSKSISSSEDDNIDRKQTSGKLYICLTCSASFSHFASLIEHKRVHTGEKLYKCLHCAAAFFQIDKLKSHMRVHSRKSNDKNIKVDETPDNESSSLMEDIEESTYEDFFPENKVVNKLQTNSTVFNNLTKEKRKTHSCTKCKAQFATYSTLVSHIRTHTGEKPYKCPTCNIAFTQASNLKRHLKLHTGEKPFKCPDCSASFIQRSNMQDHVTRVHIKKKQKKMVKRKSLDDKETQVIICKKVDKELKHKEIKPKKSYNCTECDQEYFSPSTLKEHMRKHNNERPFKCSECNATFTNHGNFIAHTRTHTGEKPYKCTTCEAAFSQSSNLKRHIRLHTGERPFKCPYCPAAFIQRGNMNYHLERTHNKIDNQTSSPVLEASIEFLAKPIKKTRKPRVFACLTCDMVYYNSWKLKEHMKTHTGKRPFKCPTCQATFRSHGNFIVHNRIHTGEKPYKCDSCDASFSQTSNLKRHIRLHTGEKPYKCTFCVQAFRQQTNLKYHMRKVHPNETG